MRLRRTVLTSAGITRRRHRRGFSYRGADGEALTDEATLRRIDELVIPPAWKKVRISPHANGHIQAVGTDAAGGHGRTSPPPVRPARPGGIGTGGVGWLSHVLVQGAGSANGRSRLTMSMWLEPNAIRLDPPRGVSSTTLRSPIPPRAPSLRCAAIAS